ncbi:hypothetical protein [Mesorhizobium neociceri]|uniref:Uncharacterized protein n=1 Tax=Mesorhizobium neociceri TaxID=1307853 RepID=A0A838AYY2_9HYPH|nr:hypothetical protein [Mesorhizobium neociceri]MBA1139305.1 hypothetical protein [Mesorhizobium neociceri]
MNVDDARKLLADAGYTLADRPPMSRSTFTNEILLSWQDFGPIGVIFEIGGDTSAVEVDQFIALGRKRVGPSRVVVIEAPPGKYQVVCVKPKKKGFPHQEWHHGDFDTRPLAIAAAKEQGNLTTFAYVYNEHGACSYCNGGPPIFKRDGYKR